MYADHLGFITYQMNGLPIVSGYYYDWTDLNHDRRVQRNEVDLVNGFESIYHVDPAVAPNPPNQLASDFKTPTTDELTIGADHQLMPDLAVSATYTYRHATNLQTREALGSGPGTWKPAGTAVGTAIGVNGQVVPFNVPFYNLTLTSIPSGDIFLNRPEAVQNYKGLEVAVVKRLADKWMFRASGGWNHWTQNISPADVALDPNNDWGRAGQNTDGGTVVGYSGKSTTWVSSRWQFNMTGMYQFPLGINLGANLFGREGFPQSYYVRTCSRCADIDGTRYRNLVSNIDTYRLDNVYQLDLHLEKAFNLGPVVFTALAEVFNVTNNAAVLQRVSNAGTWNFDADPGEEFSPNGTFDQIFEVQSPTILRLGARIAF